LVPHLTIHMVPFYYSRALFAREAGKKARFHTLFTKTHQNKNRAGLSCPASVPQKRHAPGGTHFCPHARDRHSFPLVSPWGQNLALNRALAAKRLAHSQRQISLQVSRPSAHVGWTGLFGQSNRYSLSCPAGSVFLCDVLDAVFLFKARKVPVVPDQHDLLKAAGGRLFEARGHLAGADAAPDHRLPAGGVVGLFLPRLL